MGVTASELVSVKATRKSSVYDSSSLTESITAVLVSLVVLTETVTVSEAVTVQISSPKVSVSDSITVTEDITPWTNKYHLSVSDNVTITEDVSRGISTGKINIYDSATVTDIITMAGLPYVVSVDDAATITELISGVASLAGIAVDDAISLAEDIHLTHVLNICPTEGASFGKTDVAGSLAILTGNYINAIRFQSGSAGTLKSISVYVQYYSAEGNIKCAIYDDSLNLVNNGTTEQKAITTEQDGWMTFNFSTPPSVTASTYYRLAVWTGTGVSWRTYRESGTTNQRAWQILIYTTWPDPLSPGGYQDYKYSIYATLQGGLIETISVSESITPALSLAGISVYDTASIAESIVSNLVNLVSVSDAVTLTEYIKTLLACTISKSEAISVTESITNALIIPGISVSEAISLFEGIYLDLWVQRTKETDLWTERTKPTDTWTERTKETDTWTERTKEDDTWKERTKETDTWTERSNKESA